MEKYFRLKLPEAPGKTKAGIYHFRREEGGNVTRFHLRVDPEGSGMLLANSSVAVRLSPSGVAMAKAILEGMDKNQISLHIQQNFRGATEQAVRDDLEKVQGFISTLSNPEDNYPIFNLDDPALIPSHLLAPFHAQMPVGSPGTVNPLLTKLWDAGILHVTFAATASGSKEDAVLNIERAEDIGMITGLRGPASWIHTGDLLQRVAAAGVDYITVPVVSSHASEQDAILGMGDFENLQRFFADCRKLEVCPVAEIPLLASNVQKLPELLSWLESRGVKNVFYYAVAADQQPQGLGSTPIIQAALDVEELSHHSTVRYVWLAPVSAKGELRQVVENGPRCAGDVSIRVELDGMVYPARGPMVPAGNLLAQTWNQIWNHKVFQRYRERIEAPTRCSVCPGLAICAADCPGDSKGWAIFVAVLLFFSLLCGGAHAQDYRFRVPDVQFDVTVNKDGSATLQYAIHFVNTESGHPIDIVDVGLPTADYKISNMSADLDGNPLSTIKKSQYVDPGVEVHLDDYTIQPNGEGTLHFQATIPDLVFSDTTRKDYVSFQITPTWFGSQFVVDWTALSIRVHLPQGLKPDEVLYQQVPFTGKEVVDGSVVVSWNTNKSFTSEYRVGVSFPARAMSHFVVVTKWDLIKNWFRKYAALFVALDFLAFMILLIVAYKRLTGGTGSCLVVPLLGFGLGGYMISWVSGTSHVLAWVLLLGVVCLVEFARKHRRMKYLPAMASVEGGGIKRGLTAPEAAVLLELPVNKVITMVLFGLLKKNFIRQVSKDPVSFNVNSPAPGGVVLNGYEKEMLSVLQQRERIAKGKEARLAEMDFTAITDALIKSVVAKMQGFNVEETREYYKHIITRAWAEAKNIGDLPAWQKNVDDKIDWLMLDQDFDHRFQPYTSYYNPGWYHTSYPRTSGMPGAGVSLPTSSGGTTQFSDIAGSITGWMQNTAGSVVSKIEGPKGGLINLSSVDKAFASSGGGGGRSGGGGGCACACAGCACACACAGGGR